MTVKDIMLITMFAVIACLVVFRGCDNVPPLPPTVTTEIIHDTVEIQIVKNMKFETNSLRLIAKTN